MQTAVICAWKPIFDVLCNRVQSDLAWKENDQARTSRKVAQTLTYSCTSPQDLHDLTTTVERLITDFREKVPKLGGIVFCPQARKSLCKRAQQILRKY